jgi:hypothetical protein
MTGKRLIPEPLVRHLARVPVVHRRAGQGGALRAPDIVVPVVPHVELDVLAVLPGGADLPPHRARTGFGCRRGVQAAHENYAGNSRHSFYRRSPSIPA